MTDDSILKTEDLRMVYHVGTVEVFALRGVDIQVQKGEFVSIVGPSGCGKSTLLHLLGGLARPTYGRIFVDGDEISAAADADRTRIRREKIGFVFQRFNLLPTLTVKGNLEIACQIQGNGRPSKERVADVLDRVGLRHKAVMKPLDLSAGEQQRIAIARALVNDPQLVLADEPTGNLDPDLSLEIMNLFREINARGTTVVVATHDRELIRRVGRRAVSLDHGRIVEVA
jgi:ABC-type lipoprotein export system ATPase subunit